MELYVPEEKCERCGKATDELKKTEFMLRAEHREMNLCENCIEDLKKKFNMHNSRLAMFYLQNVNRFVAMPRCAVCSQHSEDLFVYKFDIEGHIYELELCGHCYSEIMTMYRHFQWELQVQRICKPRELALGAMAF